MHELFIIGLALVIVFVAVATVVVTDSSSECVFSAATIDAVESVRARLLRHSRPQTISSANFTHGTLRLRESGIYVLSENITFSPNEHADFRPRPSQVEYKDHQFVLGFFAAITIEVPDVLLDLGGYSIEASSEFALQQRFFTLIQLGAQPFISGQGPAHFGDTLAGVNGCIIENGVLGRSAHHGIHGNGGTKLLIQNVVLRDYEVAGIALNGFSESVLRGVHLQGTRSDIPVIGTYSNARFLVPMAQAVAENVHLVEHGLKQSLMAAIVHLQELMDQTLADVSAHGSIRQNVHAEAYALFANPSGLIDGNSYGIVLHPLGMSAGSFWHEQQPQTNNIVLQDVTIDNTRGKIVEVVALANSDNRVFRGPVGDVLRMTDNGDNHIQLFGEQGQFAGNALANVQIELASAVASLPESERKMGTLHVSSGMQAWKHGQITLQSLIAANNYTYLRNGDTMFHVNKGMVGLRVGGMQNVCVERVRVNNVQNGGNRGNCDQLLGETADNFAYVSGKDGGHPGQGLQYGYMGADARGISISASSGIHFCNTSVTGVHSAWGFSRGIDIFNSASDVHADAHCSIDNVTALTHANVSSGQFTIGPKVGSAIGLRISHGSAPNTHTANVIAISNVVSRAIDLAFDNVIDSANDFLTPKTSAESANVYGEL